MGVACNEALQPERRNHLSTRPVRKLRGQTRPDLARSKLSQGPYLIEYLLSNCAFKGTIKFWKLSLTQVTSRERELSLIGVSLGDTRQRVCC